MLFRSVRGPTCVFPNLKTGGELLSNGNQLECQNEQGGNKVELITVPAVGGRLLRFEGSSLHAVPRPADLWFLSFVKGAPEYSPEETWGRSVILFNTWADKPPKDVETHQVLDSPGVIKKDLVNSRNLWDEVFQLDSDTKTSRDDAPVCDADPAAAPMSKVKIWLLGNERRRDYQMRTIKMKANPHVKDAFLESHTVSRVILEQ